MANSFNYKGSRYTKIYVTGFPKDAAEEKLEQRRKLAPQFKWAIKKDGSKNKYTKEPNYVIGRATK